MTIDQFALITLRVIARDGFADFLPTACYPMRREISALAELPRELNQEVAVLEWAARSATSGEEFLVAFKISEDHFRIIRREGANEERKDYHAYGPPDKHL